MVACYFEQVENVVVILLTLTNSKKFKKLVVILLTFNKLKIDSYFAEFGQVSS